MHCPPWFHFWTKWFTVHNKHGQIMYQWCECTSCGKVKTRYP